MSLHFWERIPAGAAALAVLLICPVAAATTVAAALVKDINLTPAASSSIPQRLRSIDGKVYFTAFEPATGSELYVSEAALPARRVVDLAPGPASSQAQALGLASGRLIVSSDDGVHGAQLWAMDPAGGTPLHLSSEPVFPDTDPNLAQVLGTIGDKLVYRFARTHSLWITDGTIAGTEPLDGADSLPADRDAQLCRIGAGAVVLKPTGPSDYVLIASDGEPANNRQLAVLSPVGAAVQVLAHGGYCYFAVRGAGNQGWTLWRSDGSASGTAALRSSGASLVGLATLGEHVFIAESAPDFRLLRLDLAEPVVRYPAVDGARPRLFATAHRLVFLAPYHELDQRTGIFISDGTAAGTWRPPAQAELYSLALGSDVVLGDLVLFAMNDRDSAALDALSGTVVSLGSTLRGLYPGDLAIRDQAVLLAGEDEHGVELWHSDGTLAGTRRLDYIWASTADGLSDYRHAASVAVVGDVALLANVVDAGPDAPRHALWRSDGSSAGTWPLARAAYDDGDISRIARSGTGAVFVSESGVPTQARFYRTDTQLSQATLLGTKPGPAPLLLDAVSDN